MAEMLLINPRRRKAGVKRRKNPIAARAAKTVANRRKNPIAALRRKTLSGAGRHRRRRNPISLGVSQRDFLTGIKTAVIGASGAVAMDLLMGQINPHLPASLQTNPQTVGVGDAVKAALTVVAGKVLSKATRGLSDKMATGALTVQAHGIITAYLPQAATVGYATPARVVTGTNRVGPIPRRAMNAYARPGATALLSAYPTGAGSPLLNRAQSAAQREGVIVR